MHIVINYKRQHKQLNFGCLLVSVCWWRQAGRTTRGRRTMEMHDNMVTIEMRNETTHFSLLICIFCVSSASPSSLTVSLVRRLSARCVRDLGNSCEQFSRIWRDFCEQQIFGDCSKVVGREIKIGCAVIILGCIAKFLLQIFELKTF